MIEIAVGSLLLILLVLLLTIGLLAARNTLIPQESLIVTVNSQTRIDAARGDVLLSVLQGAGVAVPAACGGKGTCGLCRVAVLGEGAGVPVATERGILSPSERKDHIRLACQVNLRGAVDVSVASGMLDAESFDCQVRSNRMPARNPSESCLTPSGPRTSKGRPGSLRRYSGAMCCRNQASSPSAKALR